ncbi:ATPase family associated with various cellular activities, partial [Prunus dulcis]
KVGETRKSKKIAARFPNLTVKIEEDAVGGQVQTQNPRPGDGPPRHRSKPQETQQDCPHLLFYGPSGSGKKTLIIALLRQIFGPSADKVKVENRTWKVDAGSRTIDIELTTLSSTNHIELNPSDAGFQDRYIVQEIIKEMAKNRPIDTKGKKGYKILVLNEVDKLSREAQHSLRRTMEKYSAYCRLILCCNSSSKVTEAIRSRCLNVRINAPTEEQIVKVLEFIGKKEGLQLPSGFPARIAEKSNRSLRRAILSFETCRVQQYPFTSNQAIPPMDWEEYVSEIASDIMKEQSPKRCYTLCNVLLSMLLYHLRCIMLVLQDVKMLYIKKVRQSYFLIRLLFELLKKLDAELKHEVCHWAAYYAVELVGNLVINSDVIRLYWELSCGRVIYLSPRDHSLLNKLHKEIEVGELHSIPGILQHPLLSSKYNEGINLSGRLAGTQDASWAESHISPRRIKREEKIRRKNEEDLREANKRERIIDKTRTDFCLAYALQAVIMALKHVIEDVYHPNQHPVVRMILPNENI